MLWRFLGGLGLGGATPIAVALSAEYSPKRVRGTTVMVVYCGFAVGAALGGLLSTVLVKAFGWQSVFLLGGAIPLLILAFIVLRLPESISSLAMLGRKPFLIARYVKQIDPSIDLDPNGKIVVDDRAQGFPVSQLFAEGRTRRTLVLWLMFFGNILSLYFMVSWFPTLTHAAGVPIESAVIASALIQVGSIVGTFTLAGLVRKFDTFTVMSLGYAGGAISLILMSLAGASVPYVMLVAFLGGFFVIGTQTGANGIGSIVYPASIRATGVGWALGIGRFGAVLGPLAGGMLVAWNWPTSSLYVAAAAPAAVAALSALGLSRMLRRGNAEFSTQVLAR